MPLRNAKPLTLRMRGASDAIDGTNAAPGSMFKLTNVVPSTRTSSLWEPRPARVYVAAANFFPVLLPPAVGAISCHLMVGNLCFGMIATNGAPPGYDQPFCCNVLTGQFIPIFGVTANNLPTAQSTAGNWTPPVMAQIGQRIVVTHPGFTGNLIKFGWFDISSFSATITGDLTAGSTAIEAVASVIGLQPGMTVTGVGIPAGTTLVDFDSPVIQVVGNSNNAGDPTITLNYTAPPPPLLQTGFDFPFDGQAINGPGIASGTVVAPGGVSIVNQSNTLATIVVTLSQPATGSSGGTPTYIFSGEYELIISQPATIDAFGSSFVVAGGTATAPLWGAGDAAVNHLPSQPVGVAQYNGEAWFACGINGAPFSDPLAACVRTNESQALTTGDGLPTTALAGLPLTSALTGGIIQALILFEGAAKVQEVTGDFSTTNLSLNELNIPTGTLAPRTICPSMLGLAFVSPEGLRIIDFGSRISEPIGAAGQGVTLPFMFSQVPTRMSAAANSDVIRIAVEDDLPGGQFSVSQGRVIEEWWYHASRKVWSGPHSLQSTGIQPWTSPESGVNSFIVTCADIESMLCRSDTYVSGDTTYLEGQTIQLTGYIGGGALIVCELQTTLLPDNDGMSMNTIVEAALALKMPSDMSLTITAFNEAGEQLDQVMIAGLYAMPITGVVVSGAFLGYGVEGFLNQYKIPWHVPLIFKQCSIALSATARFGLTFGNLYLRYQIGGDFLADFPMQPMIAQGNPPLDDTTGLPVAVGLTISGASAPGTKIGTIVVSAAGAVVLNPVITLNFNQQDLFGIEQFVSTGITGDTHGTTAIDTLSADVILAGWDVGMGIADSALELGTGTVLAAFAAGGLSATLSQVSAAPIVGDTFTVTGQNLVTNWTFPIAAGTFQIQMTIEAPGFRTSFVDFLITVT